MKRTVKYDFLHLTLLPNKETIRTIKEIKKIEKQNLIKFGFIWHTINLKFTLEIVY